MILLVLVALAVVIVLGGIVFSCAVYALPFYAGLIAARLAYQHDAGLLGSGLTGVLVAGTVWGLGRGIFAVARSPAVRIGIASLYAAPAAYFGYEVVHGLLQSHDIAPGWVVAWSALTGIFVAGTAVVRLVAPAVIEPGVRPVSSPPPVAAPTQLGNARRHRRPSTSATRSARRRA